MIGRCRIGLLVSVVLLLFSISLFAEPGYYIQQGRTDGIVSIEAENYATKQAGEEHTWEPVSDKAGFSGKGAMVSLPDIGASEDIDYGDSPNVDYKVNFVRTGRYYIWIRGWGLGDGNSCHLDLDHCELSSGEEIGFDNDRWNWAYENDDDEHAYFDIETSGVHTISLCMREDGLTVDKIILTTNPDYQPEGLGPAPSTEGGVMSFDADQMSVLETAVKDVLIPVELASTGKGKFSVDYTVVGGTADSADFVLIPGTLEFDSGDKSKTIKLGIVQDGLDEQDETVVIKLSHPKGKDAQVGIVDTLTYTILDPRPVVEFAASSSGVAEEEGFVAVGLRLSVAYDKPVKVNYIATGGTASADDYTLASNTVTFKPGQLESSIEVAIKADVVDEVTETIGLKLIEAKNAVLEGRNEHTVSICTKSYAQLGGAYYFRYNSGERWEKYAKVGKHADAMVKIGDGDDRLVFWRGASYRPFLDTEDGKSYIDVVVPQNGDGLGFMFDRTNKHSHIRIVERSPARVIVEWRYLPDFDKPGPEWWTEEYFTVYPDGVCYRSVKTGTETLKQYQDPSYAIVHLLLLTDKGICPLPKSWARPIKLIVDSSTHDSFNDLGFDRTKGSYTLGAGKSGVSGRISFEIAANVSNPALFVKGWGDAGVAISVDGKAFDGFKIGHTKKMDNDDLVLWFGKDFKAGSKVVIVPVGGRPPVVRAPVRDPYKSKIPLLPEGLADPGPFGAYYKILKYWDQWDAPRRVGDYADVVVQFAQSPDRLIFWRGTTNVPHWVNEKNHWYENEFCERRGDDSGLDGLCEPMQDHDSSFSNVRIIHSTPARVIVHWRYSPVTLSGDIPFTDETGWGDCVDEYHYVYPDETDVRDTTLYTSAPNVFNEWHEAIPLVNPGMIPEDVLDMQAFSMANTKGETILFNFEKGFPPNSDFKDGYNIILIGMKGKGKPFAICESAGQWFDPISKPDDTRFNHYDDWPAWPKKYRRADWDRHPEHNYREFWRFLPSHSSLMHLDWDNYEDNYDGPIIWLRKVLLNGITHSNDVKSLVPLAQYWENAPLIKVTGYGYSGAVFDKSQKAYQIERRVRTIDYLVNRDDDKKPNEDAEKVDLQVFASEESPLINPCFVINGWPEDARAKLYINRKEVAEGKDFRQGVETDWGDWDTKSSLVVWARCSSTETINFTIEQVK
ncbi:MAG: Calx-beta domain-containing protein [Planctomycetota bacterium]